MQLGDQVEVLPKSIWTEPEIITEFVIKKVSRLVTSESDNLGANV